MNAQGLAPFRTLINAQRHICLAGLVRVHHPRAPSKPAALKKMEVKFNNPCTPSKGYALAGFQSAYHRFNDRRDLLSAVTLISRNRVKYLTTPPRKGYICAHSGRTRVLAGFPRTGIRYKTGRPRKDAIA